MKRRLKPTEHHQFEYIGETGGYSAGVLPAYVYISLRGDYIIGIKKPNTALMIKPSRSTEVFLKHKNNNSKR